MPVSKRPKPSSACTANRKNTQKRLKCSNRKSSNIRRCRLRDLRAFWTASYQLIASGWIINCSLSTKRTGSSANSSLYPSSSPSPHRDSSSSHSITSLSRDLETNLQATAKSSNSTHLYNSNTNSSSRCTKGTTTKTSIRINSSSSTCSSSRYNNTPTGRVSSRYPSSSTSCRRRRTSTTINQAMTYKTLMKKTNNSELN